MDRDRAYEYVKKFRDCIQDGVINGRMNKNYGTMKHAIAAEYIRLGGGSLEELYCIYDFWIERSGAPIEQETRQDMYHYGAFAMKKGYKTSCRGLKAKGLCLGEEGCRFYQEISVIPDLPFNMESLSTFLESKYSAGGKGRLLTAVVRAIRKFQEEEPNARKTICIGMRGIARSVSADIGTELAAEEVKRLVSVLLREGVLTIAEQGQSGPHRKKANGYRWLPWVEKDEDQ